MIKDELLISVSKPGRYIGNEFNSVHKETLPSMVRFAFCFPDVYEIGMSNLGLQILYFFLNEREDIFCERVFMPWPDMINLLHEENKPLFAVESHDPLEKFDFLGFSLQVELSYTNVLAMLELADIPIKREDRNNSHPIVCAGGTCAYNPEPMSDFFDFFYIGDGEASLYEVIDKYKEHRNDRSRFLQAICNLPGIYVPTFYTPTYNDDGTFAAFNREEFAPAKVKRALEQKLDYYPSRLITTLVESTQNRTVLEIARGCTRGCRFCQAGFTTRPMREREYDSLVSLTDELLKATGHSEITLLSLSACDYSRFDELIDKILSITDELAVNISLPSTRLDAIPKMAKLKTVRVSSLTVAPEAGSQRLRDIINKNLTEEEILSGCFKAFSDGYDKIKLYFMSGLPFEEIEDTNEIIGLCKKIVDEYYKMPIENRRRPVAISVSTACFIPKPFTPFQWAAQQTPEAFENSQKSLKGGIKSKRINYRYHDAYVAQIEGVLARGDRRLGKVIELAYKNGAILDGWSEHFDYDAWIHAFSVAGLSLDFYAHRQRNDAEIFPWDFIDCGVTKEYLMSEWKRAKEGMQTPGCSEKCMNCGGC